MGIITSEDFYKKLQRAKDWIVGNTTSSVDESDIDYKPKTRSVDDDGDVLGVDGNEQKVKINGSIVENVNYNDLVGSSYTFSQEIKEISVQNTGKPKILVINNQEILIPINSSFNGRFEPFIDIELWDLEAYCTMDDATEYEIKDYSQNETHAISNNINVIRGLTDNSAHAVEGNGSDSYIETDIDFNNKSSVKFSFDFKIKTIPSGWKSFLNCFKTNDQSKEGWYCSLNDESIYFGSIRDDDESNDSLKMGYSLSTDTIYTIKGKLTNGEKEFKLLDNNGDEIKTENSSPGNYFWGQNQNLNPVHILSSNVKDEHIDAAIDNVIIFSQPEPGSFQIVGGV